ncbi:MAG: hypothetical protein R3E10_12280 [Gemmatimonadota bacterium]
MMEVHTALPRITLLLVLVLPVACGPSEATPGSAEDSLPSTAALAAPGPDIVLADLVGHGTDLRLENALNVTERPGYDNQPAFTPDGGTLLYTQGTSDGRTDIIRYDLATGTRSALHPSPGTSEYSALVHPDGSGVVVVRVEPDSTQRLWLLSEGGEDVLLPDLKPVGYHAWVDVSHVALFVLGNPATLQLADPTTGTTRVMAERIGRSLQRLPGRRAISFTAVPDSVAWIRVLDVDEGSTRDLVPALEGSEDHAWTPDGTLIMGRGSVLYARSTDVDGTWRQIADLSELGSNITRIAVHPQGTHIAIVLEPARER